MFKLKRIYEEAAADDGLRVLVDRLWPRGMSKEKAAVDLWLKDIAPSPGLRQWFAHDPARWEEFRPWLPITAPIQRAPYQSFFSR
nr:DUF488 family protein [Moorella sp. Hama-1]